MNSLIPYLIFPGTCKEAMEFYASVLKGKVTSMRSFKDSPINVPEDLQNRIFDSELVAGEIRLKASDDLPDHQVKPGTNISLFVTISNEEERENVFKKLSEEGNVLFPLDENFGMLNDKYGIQWMLA